MSTESDNMARLLLTRCFWWHRGGRNLPGMIVGSKKVNTSYVGSYGEAQL